MDAVKLMPASPYASTMTRKAKRVLDDEETIGTKLNNRNSTPAPAHHGMLTILITDAFPMRCSATMHSPLAQYPAALA